MGPNATAKQKGQKCYAVGCAIEIHEGYERNTDNDGGHQRQSVTAEYG